MIPSSNIQEQSPKPSSPLSTTKTLLLTFKRMKTIEEVRKITHLAESQEEEESLAFKPKDDGEIKEGFSHSRGNSEDEGMEWGKRKIKGGLGWTKDQISHSLSLKEHKNPTKPCVLWDQHRGLTTGSTQALPHGQAWRHMLALTGSEQLSPHSFAF